MEDRTACNFERVDTILAEFGLNIHDQAAGQSYSTKARADKAQAVV